MPLFSYCCWVKYTGCFFNKGSSKMGTRAFWRWCFVICFFKIPPECYLDLRFTRKKGLKMLLSFIQKKKTSFNILEVKHYLFSIVSFGHFCLFPLRSLANGLQYRVIALWHSSDRGKSDTKNRISITFC